MLELVVNNAGICTTIQDLGRHGYLRVGIPEAGAMDGYALQVANLLVGNCKNEAALEITYPGFSVNFIGTGRISITGADLGASVNNTPIEPWQSLKVKTGDSLIFAALKTGCRAYIGLEGGIDVPLVMGSKSTYIRGKIGGHCGRRLKKGDRIRNKKNDRSIGYIENRHLINFGGVIRLPEKYIPKHYSNYETQKIRVVVGPQDNYFSERELMKFLGGRYCLTSQWDRMGYRLEGPPITHIKGPDIISDGIALGAVQIPGNKQPIIMMHDRQTVGGYTKIANVISIDISRLAQCKPGDTVTFVKVNIEEAQMLYKREVDSLKRIEMALGVRENFKNYSIQIGDKGYRVNVQLLE